MKQIVVADREELFHHRSFGPSKQLRLKGCLLTLAALIYNIH